jgi:hypothetical protein
MRLYYPNREILHDATACDTGASKSAYWIIGPIRNASPSHRWKRIALDFARPLSEGASVNIATIVFESNSRPAGDESWVRLRTIASPNGHVVSQDQRHVDPQTSKLTGPLSILLNPLVVDGLFELQLPTVSTTLTPVFTVGEQQRHQQQRSAENIFRFIHRCSTNRTDVAIWHEPSDPRVAGADLGIIVRCQWLEDETPPVLKGMWIESESSGLEQELPSKYSATDRGQGEDDRPTPAGPSILLDALLRLFAANLGEQARSLNRIADWHVPGTHVDSPVELRRLARHLGLPAGQLPEDTLLRMIQGAFHRFRQRGTPSEFLSLLRDVFGDCGSTSIREPLNEVQLMKLVKPGDKGHPLGSRNIVLAGLKRISESETCGPGPRYRLAGLDHLVGRAILDVDGDKFPGNDPLRRSMLEQIVESCAPAHMRIVVKYSDGPAVLNRNSALNHCKVQ